jgi:hypothetical protein
MYMQLLTGAMEKLCVFNSFDTRDPPRLFAIACGSRNDSLDRSSIPTCICIRLGSLIDCRSTRLKDEWLIKIHIQIFAVGFDIMFPGFYKTIHAEIILLWIDAF